MRRAEILNTHDRPSKSKELNVQLKNPPKELDKVCKVEEVGHLDRNVYLDRKDAADFLTRTTGKVITPEMISRFWRVSGSRYGGIVKYNSVLWMHETSLIQLMQAIRSGEDLDFIESEKDLFRTAGDKKLDKVYVTEKKILDLNSEIAQAIPPVHYLDYLKLLHGGAEGDEV